MKNQAPEHTDLKTIPTSPVPPVSICIANFNGVGLIGDCIASVRAQDFAFPIEIIVHDDGSTDGSATYLRANYSEVHLIESKENVGFCTSNNRMAAIARGQHLLLLNNDVTLFPNALDTLFREAIQLGRPAILSLPQYDAETGALIDIGNLLDPFLNSVPNRDPDRHEVAMVMGACFWVPKALWQEMGGFPEWFGSVAEDLYLCCRARLAGHPVHAIQRSGYRHRVGASFGGGKAREGKLATTYRRRALSERNKLFVMLTCYPWPLLVILFPLHILLLHLEGLLLTLIKRDGALWRSIYSPLLLSLWYRRQSLRRMRSEIQKRRTCGLRAFLVPFRCLPWKLEMLFRYGPPELR